MAADLAPAASISGTDIDAQAIDWCRANLPFATFATNGALPPLAYPDASFDLVYAISVFTHLDEDYQLRWLQELRSVVKPGGTCLVTLHGPNTWNEMPAQDQQTLAQQGFVFIRTDATRGLFPDWYQNAFHLREYVETTFSKYFDVVGFLPRGLANHQDIVVLRAPPRLGRQPRHNGARGPPSNDFGATRGQRIAYSRFETVEDPIERAADQRAVADHLDLRPRRRLAFAISRRVSSADITDNSFAGSQSRRFGMMLMSAV